jgi:hypothetical protein
MARRVALVLAVVATLALAGPSSASPGKPARSKPQGPAAAKFARDVPALKDSEWGWRIGGWGGIRRGYPLRHVPVIFVHGNNVDAADWYPVRDDFRAAGWTDQELWGISYGGLGGTNGTALHTANPQRDAEHKQMGDNHTTYITEDDVNVPDLYRFIHLVQAYTGSRRFVLVTHSLGVTLARETLRVHRELRADLAAFVGIAGANHGTTFCPPGSEGNVVSCDEIAAERRRGDLRPGALDDRVRRDRRRRPGVRQSVVRAVATAAGREQPAVPVHIPQRPASGPGDRRGLPHLGRALGDPEALSGTQLRAAATSVARS